MRFAFAWIGFATIWQGLAMVIASAVLPSPLQVFYALIEGFQNGAIPEATFASLSRVAIGYSLASTVGLGLGITLSLFHRWGRSLQSIFEVLRPIPPIAWVPLAILWFGIGNQAAWFIVFVGAFFPIFVQVYVAFLRPPVDLMELAQQYELSSSNVFWSIRLPAAAPEIFQALRVGLGVAWTSVIAAELVGVRSGLGDRIGQLRFSLDYDGVIACMLCIGCLGWFMSLGAHKLEHWLCPWVSYRSKI